MHRKKSKEKTALAAKKQRDGISGISPKRFSGRLRVRPRFARTVFLPFACACLAERSDATCHRQAHALVPNLQRCIIKNNSNAMLCFTEFNYFISFLFDKYQAAGCMPVVYGIDKELFFKTFFIEISTKFCKSVD